MIADVATTVLEAAFEASFFMSGDFWSIQQTPNAGCPVGGSTLGKTLVRKSIIFLISTIFKLLHLNTNQVRVFGLRSLTIQLQLKFISDPILVKPKCV